MIVYQLPNGNVIYVTVEQFLSLTEDDIKYFVECNAGSNGNNPNKKLPYGGKEKFIDEDDPESDEEDLPLDITSIDDDDFIEPFDINSFFDE